MKTLLLVPEITTEMFTCFQVLKTLGHEIHVIYSNNLNNFNNEDQIFLYHRKDYNPSAPLIKLTRKINPDKIVVFGLFPAGNIHIAQYYYKLKRRIPVIMAISKNPHP